MTAETLFTLCRVSKVWHTKNVFTPHWHLKSKNLLEIPYSKYLSKTILKFVSRDRLHHILTLLPTVGIFFLKRGWLPPSGPHKEGRPKVKEIVIVCHASPCGHNCQCYTIIVFVSQIQLHFIWLTGCSWAIRQEGEVQKNIDHGRMVLGPPTVSYWPKTLYRRLEEGPKNHIENTQIDT